MRSAGSGRDDGDPMAEIGHREPGPGFVLQDIPAGVADVEGDPVDARPQVVPLGPGAGASSGSR